ncbi:D-alanyl-D-alanine carboxypeptidase/D-alanyl-D-alanine-endopeptidase [Marinobacter panjinensis]|uniref:D-alanyl-D-alanine carboxypeptidase/D-alanyl-D-alanine-endopeptidase n=2 Tax=Marinobacter panjinensis TaxID=2576384 RepID=A0A4U6QTB2_9GAMM|nr:D-alanyl-D-alanine carboxypeptidase/D-alanyl-D-alanine-endopeptidase [Marinobacter panjinensis]MCR8914988.1 D-alanyl-D-alanine carboxypeptidase/D-alanyl-D-alanine-endopeptidase [Marinobacter panjinensis]TKV64227.1 D-alanyl-D-alanine carboxypeptidase/D-alanyl-D-alanine-endopeptidase [Marinobacter panjinensis]
MLLTARSHCYKTHNGMGCQHGRAVPRLLVSTLAAILSIGTAFASDPAASTKKTWSSQVRDYAFQSLNDEHALSMAAIPLNGPGIEQYINADALMSPGSILKLVTTYAALETLGPTYHWDTNFYTDGELVGDTLNGNFYVDLGGDPKLTIERLWSTLSELRGMGISAINGNLVLDGDVFKLAEGLPVFDDNGNNPHAPFLVQPSPYLTNLNLVHFQVRADERGTQAWSAPSLNDVVIDNRVTAAAEGPCPARRNFDWEPIFHDDHRVTVRVTGELPQGCRTTAYLSVLPHEQYTASLIRSLLTDMGIEISGKSLLASTPEDARLLLKTTSPDLVTMVRDINKWSSNVMARQLLLTIGSEYRLDDDEDDRVAGIRVIYQWLQDKGVNTAGMVIDNGAGLTRHGRITARQGAQILQHAWNSDYSADLMASMPLIAMDGTMARRLRNTGLDGKGRIKTGYLENVRSIAGFTRDDTNTTWAVVGMVNNDPAWNGQAVLDRIIYSLHHRPPTGTTLSQAPTSGTEIR